MCDGQKIYNKWINLLVMQWRMNQAFKLETEVIISCEFVTLFFRGSHRLLESVNSLNSHNVRYINVIEFEKIENNVFFPRLMNFLKL